MFRYIILIVTNLAILAVAYHMKVAPWKAQLDPKHRGWFDTVDKFMGPVSKFLNGTSKPYQVGQNVTVPMGEIYLIVILVAINVLVAAFR